MEDIEISWNHFLKSFKGGWNKKLKSLGNIVLRHRGLQRGGNWEIMAKVMRFVLCR